MTGLIVLEDHKLKKGESGPTITITDADVQSYQSDLQEQQSVVRVVAGEPLTELQLLQGGLIPPANNFAETLARWGASSPASIDPFVAQMKARGAALHPTPTKFLDVSGASA